MSTAPLFAPPCRHEREDRLCVYDGVQLYRCVFCGLTHRQLTANDARAEELYEGYYHNEMGTRFVRVVEYVVRAFRLFRALKIWMIVPRATTVLDIGSGRGYMLYFLCKVFKYQRAVGTQLSRPALEFSRNRLGLEIYGEDLLDHPWQPTDRFDVVTMWHVLEHVPQPEAYIAKIRTLIAPGGALVLEVPNFSSWTRGWTGEFWLGLDLRYHLSFFTPQSLTIMLERQGYRVRLIHTFSLEYSTFISVQSIVSRLTGTQQYIFSWLQQPTRTWMALGHLLLFVALTPPCFVVNLCLFFSKRGEVLTVVARPRE